MANYETDVVLPSGGIPYGEGVETKLTLRAMRGKDEKLIYGSNSSGVMNKVLNACVTTEGFDASQLLSSDRSFLLVNLRTLSYGPRYHSMAYCPECDEVHEFEYDLTELDVTPLKAKVYEKATNITLPSSGDKLVIKPMTDADARSIDDELDRMTRMLKDSKTTINAEDFRAERSIAYTIVSVNDKKLDKSKRLNYYLELLANDVAYIRHCLNTLEFGYVTPVIKDCPVCGEKVEVDFMMSPEFFRPRFD